MVQFQLKKLLLIVGLLISSLSIYSQGLPRIRFTQIQQSDSIGSLLITNSQKNLEFTNNLRYLNDVFSVAGGANFDDNTLVIDGVNNRVGIGTSSPSAKLSVTGLEMSSASNGVELEGAWPWLKWKDTENNQDSWLQYIDGSDFIIKQIAYADRNSAPSTVGTERMRIDTSGNVGIGTTIPSEKLHVVGRIMASGSGYTLNPTAPIFGQYNSTRGYVQVPSNGQFEIWNGGTAEIATFYENRNSVFHGNVGIGTNTPDTKLHIQGSAQIGDNNDANGDLTFKIYSGQRLVTSGTSSIEMLAANPSTATWGRAQIITTSPSSESSVLAFHTNVNSVSTSERMRIDATGNVGIGTTNPTAKLDVNSGDVNTVAAFRSTDAGAFIGIADPNSTLDAGYPTSSIGVIGDNLLLNTSNAERMRITSGGNVGIGTTNPSAKLEILSDGSAANGAEIRLQHANNNSTDVVSTVNFANNGGSIAMIQGGTTGANNNGYISFFTDNAGTSSEKMRIDASGNVGIGTTSPTSKLYVAGSVVYDDATNGRFTFESVAGQNDIYSTTTGFAAYKNLRLSSNELIFSTNGTNERMRITSAGNVGIGTTTPTSKLQVNGTFSRGVGNSVKTLTIPISITESEPVFLLLFPKGTNSTGELGAFIRGTWYAQRGTSGSIPQYSVGRFTANKGYNATPTIFIENAIYSYPNVQATLVTYNSVEYVALKIYKAATSIPQFAIDIELYEQNNFITNDPNCFSIVAESNTTSHTILAKALYKWTPNSVATSTGDVIFFPDGANGAEFGIDVNPSYKLHVNGSVAGVGAYNNLSDVNYKKNINDLELGLDIVKQLRPITYNWINEEYGTRTNIGFIAQEVESVLPNIVTTADDNVKSMATTDLIPILTKAIQEQQIEIETLKTQYNDLLQRIINLENK